MGEALNRRCAAHSPSLILGAQVNNSSTHPLGARRVDAKTLAPFALEYELIGPIAPEIADVSYRGDLFGVAEDSAVHTQTQTQTQTLKLGRWQPRRVWNGDQVDWGPNFTSIPQVLHVRLATY
jgi:hypothetical protein